MLSKAGDQVPVTPLFEVVGITKDVPEQTAATCVNVVVTLGFTVIVMVAVVAHNPAVGVNVYEVVAVLLIAGDQVPDIPLLDVAGIEKDVPEQIAATCVNVVISLGFTVIVMVAVVAHNPAVGVNV